MKYLELPIEKIVKYDKNDMALPDCPVCNTDSFRVVFTKAGPLTIFCRNDAFQLRRLPDLTFEAEYCVYEEMHEKYNETRDKELRILFNKGLITYVTLIGVVKYG